MFLTELIQSFRDECLDIPYEPFIVEGTLDASQPLVQLVWVIVTA